MGLFGNFLRRRMEEFYLDAILVPLSLFLLVGYHVYLWQCFNSKPLHTTIGVQSHARTAWFQKIAQIGDDRKSMQVVQSFRNNLMIIILRASISVIISSSVAALTNNAYKASTGHLFKVAGFGSQSNRVFAVKYASAFILLLLSFLCSSFGVGFLVDTSVLVSTPRDVPRPRHIEGLVERGFLLAFIGNRLMWVSFAVLLWLLSPIAVLLCSLALVWGFSVMDFAGRFRTCNEIDLDK